MLRGERFRFDVPTRLGDVTYRPANCVVVTETYRGYGERFAGKATVRLQIAPEPGDGVVVEWAVSENEIPSRFSPAFVEALQSALNVDRYPRITGVLVRVTGGTYEETESTADAYGMAVRLAWSKARYRLILERDSPVARIELGVPSGDVSPTHRITNSVAVEGRFVRQSSCPGKFGVVRLEIAPAPESNGVIMDWLAADEELPDYYRPAVIDGLLDVCRGREGWPRVIGLHVRVVGGAYHEVDSSALSYKIATVVAWQNALTQLTLVAV